MYLPVFRGKKVIFAIICQYLPLEPYLPCREIPVNDTSNYRGGICRQTLTVNVIVFWFMINSCVTVNVIHVLIWFLINPCVTVNVIVFWFMVSSCVTVKVIQSCTILVHD